MLFVGTAELVELARPSCCLLTAHVAQSNTYRGVGTLCFNAVATPFT